MDREKLVDTINSNPLEIAVYGDFDSLTHAFTEPKDLISQIALKCSIVSLSDKEALARILVIAAKTAEYETLLVELRPIATLYPHVIVYVTDGTIQFMEEISAQLPECTIVNDPVNLFTEVSYLYQRPVEWYDLIMAHILDPKNDRVVDSSRMAEIAKRDDHYGVPAVYWLVYRLLGNRDSLIRRDGWTRMPLRAYDILKQLVYWYGRAICSGPIDAYSSHFCNRLWYSLHPADQTAICIDRRVRCVSVCGTLITPVPTLSQAIITCHALELLGEWLQEFAEVTTLDRGRLAELIDCVSQNHDHLHEHVLAMGITHPSLSEQEMSDQLREQIVSLAKTPILSGNFYKLLHEFLQSGNQEGELVKL